MARCCISLIVFIRNRITLVSPPCGNVFVYSGLLKTEETAKERQESAKLAAVAHAELLHMLHSRRLQESSKVNDPAAAGPTRCPQNGTSF